MSTDQIKMLKLESSDGELFEMALEEALQSRTLKNMIDDNCAEGVIPMTNVTGWILSMVIEYCKKHATAATDEADDELKAWDADFIDVDQSTVFDLIMAANYLDIAGLMNLTCQSVADMLKGKTPEEIRSTFNIKNDFTPEEEEEIRKQHQWAFE